MHHYFLNFSNNHNHEAMAKIYKTTYPDKYASAVDEIVHQGGTWDELLKECQQHAVRLGVKPHTKSTFRGHIIWRQGEDSMYLGRYKMTKDGVEIV